MPRPLQYPNRVNLWISDEALAALREMRRDGERETDVIRRAVAELIEKERAKCS